MKLHLVLAVLSITSMFSIQAQDSPLRVGDAVEIRIGGVPGEEQGMINNVYTVDADGSINLPHIGSTRARGLTGAQLAISIQNAYKAAQIYTNPTIAISQQSAARFVTLGGEVRAPQRVTYTTDLTLTAAIQAAGGFTDFANRKNVVLLSGGKRMVVDTTMILNNKAEDIKLAPGDQIQVQSSPW